MTGGLGERNPNRQDDKEPYQKVFNVQIACMAQAGSMLLDPVPESFLLYRVVRRRSSFGGHGLNGARPTPCRRLTLGSSTAGGHSDLRTLYWFRLRQCDGL